ncbi:MAG: MerR family transcriptional regulator [Thermoanaerobaculia bacterium]|nr:MerR family transcriptional regulator [Thermoanaerobaculia bacterium]
MTEAKKNFKIGEVCKLADVEPYVLRYWETEFEQLAPKKSGGGQRQYTQAEIDIILRIKKLLYGEGFTIAGAKKKLESESAEDDSGSSPPSESASPRQSEIIQEAKRELRELLDLLQ